MPLYPCHTRTCCAASVLNLVDLAGSERFDQTGGDAERQKEARIINTSLLALASVIAALAQAAKSRRRGQVLHIPYRASKLTQLLKSSFGGNTVSATQRLQVLDARSLLPPRRPPTSS